MIIENKPDFLYIMKNKKIFLVPVHYQLYQLLTDSLPTTGTQQHQPNPESVGHGWHSAISKRVVGKTIQGFINQHVLVLPSLWLCTQSQLSQGAFGRGLELLYCVYITYKAK